MTADRDGGEQRMTVVPGASTSEVRRVEMSPTGVGVVRCTYCTKPCDGTLHDLYGEWRMKRSDLVVCIECDDEFTHEDGPWNEAE